MTLDEALQQREYAQKLFVDLLTEKVRSIQKHYDNPKLNEKQLHFLKKDEELVKSAEGLVNICLAQINFLIHENKQQLIFMQDMQRDVSQYQEMFINLCLEMNELKQKTGEAKFNIKSCYNATT